MEDGRLCQWSVCRSLLAIVQWWGFNVTVIIINKWIFQVPFSLKFCFIDLHTSGFILIFLIFDLIIWCSCNSLLLCYIYFWCHLFSASIQFALVSWLILVNALLEYNLPFRELYIKNRSCDVAYKYNSAQYNLINNTYYKNYNLKGLQDFNWYNLVCKCGCRFKLLSRFISNRSRMIINKF